MALTVVIAYDVSVDNTRARLAGMLQQFGDRIQYSVFLCRVERDALDELLERARHLIDPRTDSIYVLRQCGNCWSQVVTVGQASPPERRLYWAVW